jgi:hypothetical protein
LNWFYADLDLFAQWLKDNANAQKKFTLIDIKNEMNNPFKDCRERYEDIPEWKLFGLLAGEGDEGLKEGQIVNVKVVEICKCVSFNI